MIIVTGAAGFIGSCLIQKLNDLKFRYIIAVDDFSNSEKNRNLEGKAIMERVDRKDLFGWLEKNNREVEFFFHIGARTDTTEFDTTIFDELNLDYSKKVWQACVAYQIPLVYASSAATYGLGELGYDDNESLIPSLKPLNPYGDSKNDFDIWALQQEKKPFFFAGLKFFNVYGPNEFHKGRMASVIWHAYRQIQANGSLKLFKSHRDDFKDGEQMRDFLYVKDAVQMTLHLASQPLANGLYNLGSGQAHTWVQLARAIFSALGQQPNIEFVEMPEHLKSKYQYYTCADIAKLLQSGYQQPLFSLADAVRDYVQGYLVGDKRLGDETL